MLDDFYAVAFCRQLVLFLAVLALCAVLLGNGTPAALAVSAAGAEDPPEAAATGKLASPQSYPKAFFTLRDGTDLRQMGGAVTRRLLTLVSGGGSRNFGQALRQRYCGLKPQNDIQWRLDDLETGRTVSQSREPERIFFGASVSKLFVAAALLDKQQGRLNREQLRLMTRMIAVSSNSAWKALQRQAGDDISADAGRRTIDAFTRRMGYGRIRGFQGWWRDEIHGNELNVAALSTFLYDTYHSRYPGAEIVWKLMHACRTGGKKGNLYLPANLYIGGKTGTYHGPNASPQTVDWPVIRAHHHVMTFNWGGRQYGLSILSNRGNDGDVAVLAGGLVREHLNMPQPISCPNL